MAFFNFIETFFFISLGITFILVLLLVYHFKQRMTGLEQKCDTMFEIINDMVKEMNMLRVQITMQPQVHNLFHPMNNYVPQFNVNDILNKDAHEEYDSEESSNVGNSEDEESLNQEEDDEDEEDNEEDNEDEVVNESPIKIINVNQETLADLNVENIPSNDEENAIDTDEEEKEEKEEEETTFEETIAEDPILVEKIEPIEEVDTNEELANSNSKESDKEVYKKMSLGALKALVISKGLCSDARTLRKNDLLKLLEEE
jgi:hypothetical protein